MKLNIRQPEKWSKTNGVVLLCNRFLSAALFAVMLSACSADSESVSEIETAVNSTATADMAIATALYFDQRTPDGFYKEIYHGDKFYIANHVKNIDLIPIADRLGMTVFELTSDDYVEAMNWSEQSASLQTSYKQLVDNSETLLYHQFTRVDPTSPQFVFLNRVLKASAFDRNGDRKSVV